MLHHCRLFEVSFYLAFLRFKYSISLLYQKKRKLACKSSCIYIKKKTLFDFFCAKKLLLEFLKRLSRLHSNIKLKHSVIDIEIETLGAAATCSVSCACNNIYRLLLYPYLQFLTFIYTIKQVIFYCK